MQQRKAATLELLREQTLFRVKPAEASGGVGLFAVRQIPEGTNLFPELAEIQWVEIERKHLRTLPDGVREMVSDYLGLGNPTVWIPETGLTFLSGVFFMNHSETPNVATDDEGETFHAIRAIAEGEELTIDYRTYCKQWPLW